MRRLAGYSLNAAHAAADLTWARCQERFANGAVRMKDSATSSSRSADPARLVLGYRDCAFPDYGSLTRPRQGQD